MDSLFFFFFFFFWFFLDFLFFLVHAVGVRWEGSLYYFPIGAWCGLFVGYEGPGWGVGEGEPGAKGGKEVFARERRRVKRQSRKKKKRKESGSFFFGRV